MGVLCKIYDKAGLRTERIKSKNKMYVQGHENGNKPDKCMDTY